MLDAIVNKNQVLESTIAENMKEAYGAEVITITDEKGIVIARAHSGKHGGSVINQGAVQKALEGKIIVDVVSGTVSLALPSLSGG